VLLRTGWSQYYERNVTRRLARHRPYLGPWLFEQGVVAIGADTMGLEVEPGEQPDILYSVHAFLLVRAGIYIIERANLEEIAKEGVTHFPCLCLPPKFNGGA
jgi:kynurenine formamidase